MDSAAYTPGDAARAGRIGFPGGEDWTALFAVIVVGAVLLAVALYVAYRMIVTSLVTRLVLDGTYHCRTAPKTVAADKLPKLSGREMSLSFWVYVEDSSASEEPKRILYLGESANTADITVVLSKSGNTLYIVARTSAAQAAQTPLSDLATYLLSKAAAANAAGAATAPGAASPPAAPATATNRSHCISVVEYLPLMRWVHVGVVLDLDVVSVYVDGDLYSVASVSRQVPDAVLSNPKGGLSTGSASQGLSGYISKVSVASYAQSVWQMKSYYGAGPVSSSWLTGAVGLDGYKLQWPIAKITD